MDENDATKVDNTKPLYSMKQQQIIDGAWMMWQNADLELAQNARNAINHFEKKYCLKAREIAMGKKNDIKGIEVVDMVIPEGQIWVR